MHKRALSNKTLVVVLLGVLGLVGVAAAGLLYVGSRLTQFITEPTWGPDAVPRRDLSRVFGVRLPPGATDVVSRSSGFQDPFLEALARLPDGGVEAFLEANGLQVSAEAAEQNPDAEDELRALVPQAQHITAVALDGLADLTVDDGGAVALYRHAVLFTVDGASWVYLVAVGT